MATIYLDPSAVAGPDAAARLTHLVDGGYDLVRVTSGNDDQGASAVPARIAAVPAQPPRGSWFVTADPATCGDRQPALRTILIGPRGAPPGPTRCDATARDLRAAVLEILTADAMR